MIYKPGELYSILYDVPYAQQRELIKKHLSVWNVNDCITERYDRSELQKLCSVIAKYLEHLPETAKTAHEELVTAFYTRIFTHELNQELSHSWAATPVDPLFPYLLPSIRADLIVQVLKKINREEFIFDIESVMQGKASESDLLDIGNHILSRESPTILRCFISFGQRTALLEKMCSLESKRSLLNMLPFFGFDPKKPEDREILIKTAEICAEKDGRTTAKKIQNFGFDPTRPLDRSILFEIAKICALTDGGATAHSMENFKFDPTRPEDRKTLLEIAKIYAESCARLDFVRFANLDLTKPEDRKEQLEIIKLRMRGDLTNFHISDFGFNPKKPEDRQVLFELLKTLPPASDWTTYMRLKQLKMLNEPTFRLSSLFSAVLRADLDAVRTILLRPGIDPNMQDNNNFTPLHHAAMHDLPEIITAFIDAKADIEALGGSNVITSRALLPEKSTPLTLAAWYANKRALGVFLRLRPPPNIHAQNGFGFSASYCVYANGLSEFAHLVPETKYTRELYRTKLLAHANGIAGNTKIGTSIEFPLEGGLTYGMYREISSSLEEFHSLFRDKHLSAELKIKITQAMENASTQRSSTEIYRDICSGKLTIIPTGYHGHYRALIFYKTILVSCEERGILSYPLNLKLLTQDHIESILSQQVGTVDTNPISSDVTEALNLTFGTFRLSSKQQSVGNCSYYAAKRALRSACWVVAKDAIPHAQELAIQYAKDWSTYFRLKKLEHYLHDHEPQQGPICPADDNLVNVSFAKVLRHAQASHSSLKEEHFLPKTNALSAAYPHLWTIKPALTLPPLPQQKKSPIKFP